jgi:small subunit ribosomal protein S20
MAITKSAKKATRQTLRRQAHNRRRKEALKKAVKTVKSLVQGNSTASLSAKKGATTNNMGVLLSQAYKAIDKASKRGIIKRGSASRKKSRLALLVNRANAISPK